MLPEEKQVSFSQADYCLKTRLIAAQEISWGVIVDGYLSNAALVGDMYAASIYFDHSRLIRDGETVITPPVEVVRKYRGFTLLRSCCGRDHYVIVSVYGGGSCGKPED
ncbi:hypothetical protein BWR59_19870 [Pseudomonas sp. Bc-h]|nr:hypothetical protein BWR59_19870 [Pseudomonas sp. Bc-h]